MLIHLRKSDETLYIDYRETAPGKSSEGMYKVDEDGEAIRHENSIGYKAVAVPGTVAGLTYAVENYGNLKFSDVASYAIKIAKNGFAISKFLARLIALDDDDVLLKFRRYLETRKIWTSGGKPHKAGHRITNEGFASTLEIISKKGQGVFYQGSIGKALATDMERHRGLVDEEDLAAYSVEVRKPLKGAYRDYEVITVPPPSMGGAAVIQLLNVLENYNLKELGHNSPEAISQMARVLGLVYSNLRKKIADPKFADVPIAKLISKEYSRRLVRKARRGAGIGHDAQKNWTSHMSVIDKARNVAAITESLECFFGSGVTIPGTGFCLNDTMHDFNVNPGDVNSIRAGKRPRSSMTPTLILKDGEPFMVTGSAGGPRIITATLQSILNVIDYGFDVQRAIDAPRVHYEGGGAIKTESLIPARVRTGLKALGFETVIPNYAPVGRGYDLYFGGVHAILVGKNGELHGAADPRRQGGAAAY